MGKPKTLQSSRAGATANSINPSFSAPDKVNARPRLVRFDENCRPSVSLRVFSAAIVGTGPIAGARSKPALAVPGTAAPAKAMEQLLLQKLEALEKRIKGLEAEVEQQERTAGPAYAPVGCVNLRSDRPGAHAESFLGGVRLLF
jgi:hypothetical protein